MGNTNDFGDCACFNVRKVARLLAQAYDRALEPAGLKNTQFTLLAQASSSGPITITELARSMDLERTTLTRNLAVMERDGLLVVEPGDDARSRTVSLTPQGRARLRQAAPLWRAAQESLVRRFGRKRWSLMRSELQDMLAAARDIA